MHITCNKQRLSGCDSYESYDMMCARNNTSTAAPLELIIVQMLRIEREETNYGYINRIHDMKSLYFSSFILTLLVVLPKILYFNLFISGQFDWQKCIYIYPADSTNRLYAM